MILFCAYKVFLWAVIIPFLCWHEWCFVLAWIMFCAGMILFCTGMILFCTGMILFVLAWFHLYWHDFFCTGMIFICAGMIFFVLAWSFLCWHTSFFPFITNYCSNCPLPDGQFFFKVTSTFFREGQEKLPGSEANNYSPLFNNNNNKLHPTYYGYALYVWCKV